jgi:hypothetical protein
MAHGFKPINVLPDGDQLKRNVGDANYWARMKESSIFEEYNIISSVAFMPTLPHHLAITSSNKVRICVFFIYLLDHFRLSFLTRRYLNLYGRSLLSSQMCMA